MKKLIIIITILFCLCSCTKRKENSENYQYIQYTKSYQYLDEIDIGILKIEDRRIINKLFLPYEKPDDISSVFEWACDGLIIVEIIVDNVIIKSQIDGTLGIIETTNSEKMSLDKDNKIEMWWEVRQKYGLMYDTAINDGIYFFDFNYTKEKNIPRPTPLPYSYNIPYGSKEVKIKYKIYYPNKTIDEKIYNIKFNLIWPVDWNK
jgi:hypothetical protein